MEGVDAPPFGIWSGCESRFRASNPFTAVPPLRGMNTVGSRPDLAAMEALFDGMDDGVITVDDDGRVTYANELGIEVLGAALGGSADAETLGAVTLPEALPAGPNRQFFETLTAVLRTGVTDASEEYHEELERWFEVEGYPSTDGLTIHLRDVTREVDRRTELALREETLREVHDATTEPGLQFEERVDRLLTIGQDVLGTSHGTLSRIYGDRYVFEVVRGPDDAIAPGDIVDLAATNCERAVLSEETLVIEDVADEARAERERAGFTEWGIRCYLGTPVVVDGETYGTLCFYDTDARTEPFTRWEVTLVDTMGRWVSRELEQELTHERLRQQNDRLEQFGSMLSHDLRNPLTVAKGWTEQARRQYDDEMLAKAEDALDRMDVLISGMLEVAQAGTVVDDVELLDLAEVSASAWQVIPTASATLDTPPDVVVPASRPRVTQLLENLFDNAVTHGGPAVAVEVGSLSDGFYVADDGPGIPAGDREKALEFGYTTSADGSGLGLHIVAQIADAHGWDLAIVDRDGGGVRFEFTGVR